MTLLHSTYISFVPHHLKYLQAYENFLHYLQGTHLHLHTYQAISALYLASLLEAQKPNLNDFSNRNPSGDSIMILAPDPLALDALSANTRHILTKTWHTPMETPCASVNSATKSTNF